MATRQIRLSIKLSSYTVLMVVLSMLAAFYLTRGTRLDSVGWVFLSSAISLIVGILYTLFIDRVVTLPLQSLVNYTSRMVENDFQEALSLQSGDELGRLATSIDELRRSFLAQRRSLQELNEQLDAKVEQRTRELAEALEHLRTTQEELIKVEKLASIGRLAGGVAHEINNPAAIILTRTGLLLETVREDGLSEDILESLTVIDRQVSRISRITRDLLTFSRMAPLVREVVDISAVLEWSWSAFAQPARDSQVRLVGDIPRGVKVIGDGSGLEQVMGNLLKNALDALEGRGGMIARQLYQEDGRVRVILEDTGPGISPEVLLRIFDPFFTTKRVGKGTGLGLAISYGILQELGGTLEAANREEGGARFTITLLAAPSRPETGSSEVSLGEEER